MTSASSTASLYEEDFVRWSEEQASALRNAARSGTNLPLDWENLAEEVESLAQSQRRELRSRINTIIEHLLKLEHSPANAPRRGWAETVIRERANIEPILDDSPSLRRELADIVSTENARVARLTLRTLELYGEATSEVRSRMLAPCYSEEQVLGDWLPDTPTQG
jgi:hypothetical protein